MLSETRFELHRMASGRLHRPPAVFCLAEHLRTARHLLRQPGASAPSGTINRSGTVNAADGMSNQAMCWLRAAEHCGDSGHMPRIPSRRGPVRPRSSLAPHHFVAREALAGEI